MTTHWYCLINDWEHGPFTSQQIQELAEKGELEPEHSVRPETDSHWTPASAVPGLFSDGASQATPPVAKVAPPKVARKQSGDNRPKQSASSAKVPHGIPVADVPSTMPVGTPLATPVTPGVPSVAVSSVAPAMRSHGIDEYGKRGRRKSRQLAIVVALVGAIIFLGGVALFVMMKDPPRDVPVASARTVNQATVANDSELDPYASTASTHDAESVVTFPKLGRWLDASRQKGGLRGVAKLAVSGAWIEKPATDERVLTIDVQITNLASDQSLDFRGWSSDRTSAIDTRALLADDQGNLLRQLPAEGTTITRRIESDQTDTQRLQFSLGDNTSSSFRLALPYAAICYTGYLGFEIPILMIKDHPPGDDLPDSAALGNDGDEQQEIDLE